MLVTVYSYQYPLDEVRWGPRKKEKKREKETERETAFLLNQGNVLFTQGTHAYLIKDSAEGGACHVSSNILVTFFIDF